MKTEIHNRGVGRWSKWLLVAMAPFLFITPVLANSLDDQIRAAENQVNSTKGTISGLKSQVNTLQGQLAALSAQIASLNSQIATTQAQIDDTNQKIAANEADLAAKKKVLSELIKVSYENGQTSTFEILASSSTLG